MEDAAALLGGASSHRHSSAFDLSEVDFEYVEKLGKKDVRKLNGIILALEQEGAYPDLLRTCRQKLAEIDPNSAPQLSGPALKDEQKDAVADLLSWTASAKAKDAALRTAAAGHASTGSKKQAALPVRGHVDSAFESAPAPAAAQPSIVGKSMQLGQELNAAKLLPAEVTAAALAEKEKGNECFRAREFDDAIVFYTRSLHLSPKDTTTLNNRALAFLKLKQLDAALNDVSLVLQMDATNWKALWRRGQVHEEKRFLERALDDMRAAQLHWAKTPDAAKTPVHPDVQKSIKKVEQQLLDQDSKHPYVAHLRPKAAAATAAASAAATAGKSESKEEKEAPAKAFKRMAIAEVDEDEEEEEEAEEKVAPSAAPAAAAAPTPAPASAMRRMPIAEVDDDEDNEEEEEIVAPAKPAAPTPAPASRPAAAAAAPAAAAKPASAPAPARAPAPKKPKETFHSKNGGMMIELVSDEEEEEEEKEKQTAVTAKPAAPAVSAAAAAPAAAATGTAAAAAAPAAARSNSSSTSGAAAAASGPFVMPPVPASSVAFARDWAELRAQQRPDADLFAYFRRIEPAAIGRVVAGAGALSTAIFSQIAALIAQFYLPADLPRAAAVLRALERTERFSLNVGMMDAANKKGLRAALESHIAQLEAAAPSSAADSAETEGVSVAALRQLLQRYA